MSDFNYATNKLLDKLNNRAVEQSTTQQLRELTETLRLRIGKGRKVAKLLLTDYSLDILCGLKRKKNIQRP